MRNGRRRRENLGGETLNWTGDRRVLLEAGVVSVELETDDGTALGRYHPAPGAGVGVVWVGGAGGGLDGPARGLYPAACEALQRRGIAGLRLHYRYPNELVDCVLDTILGIELLVREGVQHVALVGHSFGGAVVITAGAVSDRAAAVVPMSTQTYGVDLAPEVSPRPMLLIHGLADEVLSPDCSRYVYRIAREPKELVLYPGAGHGLDEVREEVLGLLTEWLPEHLRSETGAARRAA
jgi:pimeloyl-ACP methyl ester carboxylesterase